MRLPPWTFKCLPRTIACLAAAAGCLSAPASYAQTEPFLGQLAAFGNTFCPRNWQPADGRLIAIASNTALFSILGTLYGGNGVSTFALPDLRNRKPVGAGTGPGLAPYDGGQDGGSATQTLTTGQMPHHIHHLTASTLAATHASPPTASAIAHTQNAGLYAPDTAGSRIPLQNTVATGSNHSFPTQSPSLPLLWCIATTGIFPSRP